MDPQVLKTKEYVRGLILRTAVNGGNIGATDGMAHAVITDAARMSLKEVRDEIHYLEKGKLIEVERAPVHPWRIHATKLGYDVVQGVCETPKGICLPGVSV